MADILFLPAPASPALVVIYAVLGLFSVVQTVRLVRLWRLSEKVTRDERHRALGSFRCGVRVGGLTSPATATYPFGRLTVLPDSLVVRFPLLGDFRFPREESRLQARGMGFELRRGRASRLSGPSSGCSTATTRSSRSSGRPAG